VAEELGVSSDAVGAILNGQWKLLRLIGEGGLAAVYEAEGLQGQGRRAIKLLHAQYRARRHIVDRFYNEAKACYTLRHPYITSVEAYAYAEDGTPYIVMELLEGMSLDDFLRRGRPMPLSDAVLVATGILQALSAAHARGLVHRDLKPANLFLVRDPSGRLAPKVLDFGIAKVMDAAGGMASKTRTGALLGTPGYMSPEQVKDAKAVDARSDLWCVAVVLYEMLTCRHPFESEDKLSRMIAVLRDPPRPIIALDPTLSSWEPFFTRGLAKDPAERFQSAEQMAEALRELGRHLAAPTAVPPQRTVAIVQAPHPAPEHSQEAPVATTAPGSGTRAPAGQPSAGYGPATPNVVGGAAMAAPQSVGAGSLRGAAQSLAAASLQALPESQLPPSSALSMHVPLAGGRYGAPASSDATPMAAHAGLGAPVAPQGSARTQVSGSGASPVQVVTAADAEPPQLVWWAVVLVALGCLALGIALGYLLASA
jgi:serine/threonine protein kinase